MSDKQRRIKNEYEKILRFFLDRFVSAQHSQILL